MSDDVERELSDLFAAVQPPAELDGRWHAAPRRAAWPVRILIGSPGQRRLRPLVAALLVPALVLVVAGGVGLRARLSSGEGGSAPNPPARIDAAMAFDAARGEVVMFGGHGDSGVLADTWTWDGSSWTQQHPAVSPPGMQQPAMAADPATGGVLLVGATPAGGGVQTWSWDGSTWRQDRTAHTPPQPRSGAMAGDPVHHRVVLVALGPPVPAPAPRPAATPLPNGQVEIMPAISSVPPAETWTWDGSDWTRSGSASTPGDSTLYQLAWDEHSHRVVMLTNAMGCASAGFAVGVPAPAQGAVVGGVLHGGLVAVAPPSTPHATPLSPTAHPGPIVAPVPRPAFFESGAASPPGGGAATQAQCGGCPSVHLWSWDGSSWHDVGLHSTTNLLSPTGMVEDPASGGELYTTVGVAWTLNGSAAPHPAPMPRELSRSQASMAADPAHHEVVLFGGISRNGIAADTWTFDGRTWTHRAGPVPPPSSPVRLGGVPLPAPETLVPRQGCAMGAFGGAQANPTVAPRTYTFPWPSGPCSTEAVTITLLDGSGRLLDVRSNGQTEQPLPALTFTWSNWCGPTGGVSVRLATGGWIDTMEITPPGCTDRSAPSILSLPVRHPAASPVP